MGELEIERRRGRQGAVDAAESNPRRRERAQPFGQARLRRQLSH